MEKILQRMSLHPSPHHLKDQTKNKTTRSGNFVYVMQMRCKDFVNSWLIIVTLFLISQSQDDGVFSQYWYQGCFLTHRSWIPASVRILIEAASAAVTVCFTDCIKFWALPTSISVASMSSSVPANGEHDDESLMMVFCPDYLTLSSKHCGFHCGQDFQLRPDCRYPFTDGEKILNGT